jgi:nitrous oxidase accessory protein NosD
MHTLNSRPAPRSKCRVVRKHIARSLIGHTVELLTEAHTIVQGVVTGVMTEAGSPKLVVGGNGYDLSQILTAMPAALNQSLQSQH